MYCTANANNNDKNCSDSCCDDGVIDTTTKLVFDDDNTANVNINAADTDDSLLYEPYTSTSWSEDPLQSLSALMAHPELFASLFSAPMAMEMTSPSESLMTMPPQPLPILPPTGNNDYMNGISNTTTTTGFTYNNSNSNDNNTDEQPGPQQSAKFAYTMKAAPTTVTSSSVSPSPMQPTSSSSQKEQQQRDEKNKKLAALGLLPMVCKPCNPAMGLRLGNRDMEIHDLLTLRPDELEEDMLMIGDEPVSMEKMMELLELAEEQQFSSQFLATPIVRRS